MKTKSLKLILAFSLILVSTIQLKTESKKNQWGFESPQIKEYPNSLVSKYISFIKPDCNVISWKRVNSGEEVNYCISELEMVDGKPVMGYPTRFSSSIEYTGNSRNISDEALRIITDLDNISMYRTWITNFEKEIEVVEKNKKYWLPVHNKVFAFLNEDRPVKLNKETDQLEIVHKPAVLGFRYLGCCYTDKQSIVLVVSVLKQ
ncbi:hypothetical protein FH589_01785 (plasmid) [Leptospira interrogans]|uniref:Lipoprotein n=1 Tax=Leptospira interrogans serovar Manilae TaxID=214675 RepID=A0AAQ1NXW4_LEPIR|nr:hypothetical protein [Leptospira interrogans]AKP28228.1 hypothetical protein LIMLP_19445 [Leptospira interrogans serovar Manilae]AKP32010.1 hypothetical protein LIMHP_19450 [Leptospira interrogans serovar Manilae]EMJ55742.1 hypothetical protein LEP1GSC013_1178 [Leptospira interrogans serovar Valbuzzi str. Duyster]ENO74217.1 hypothetical protein LEP1GSC012_3717 [Leptospira interrogans serovar Valbuzzi str. Valbuzzi]EYU61912.1 hypothetical protein CI00_02560 [Leptospira interrogans serovar Ma